MTEVGPPAASAPVKHDAYRAFRNRDFRWYIFSTFTMTFGSQLRAVVVGWQVYTITHSALSLGLSLICLDVYGRSTDRVVAELSEHAPKASAFGNFHGMAVALFALSSAGHAHAFKL